MWIAVSIVAVVLLLSYFLLDAILAEMYRAEDSEEP